MGRIKIMPVFGTRPDAIKMAPLVAELRRHGEFETVVCVSGQHREQLHSALEIFGLVPEYHLDIMRPEQTLNTIFTDILGKLDPVLKAEKPDLVLVHGDTATCFAAALCAFYNKIPVGHVEAGLRSFDKYSPFPEEMNRRLVASLADLHFAPTKLCVEQLAREGITANVWLTGNTEIDAVMYTTAMKDYPMPAELAGIDPSKRMIFVTAHRRENLGEPLEEICTALRVLAEEYEDVQIVYPVHLNPAVRETVYRLLSDHPRVILCEPVPPVTAHKLIAQSYLIMTDSGGIQEDAPALHKPALVLRRETERPEGIEAGVAKLVGTAKEDILAAARELLRDSELYDRMSRAENPYGDGHASERICQGILEYYRNK